MILYVCDPAKNTKCKGRELCGNLCTVTKHEKYAMRDKNGEPLIEYSKEYPEDEETETITVSKGCLKARKGRFVVYDVEYLKSHIEQEAAIYGNVSAIEALKKSEWIPCSERLPEDGDTYLVTIEYNGEVIGVDAASYSPFYGYIDKHWDTFEDWKEDDDTCYHVTAWMPLPEGYKKEGKK